MVTATARLLLSRDAYLEYDRTHHGKHEYVNGEVLAMAGGTPAHNITTVNVGAELRAQLKGRKPCVVHSSDQRVRIDDTGMYCYPDVTVACGKPRYTQENPPSLLNPTFLVEVLSDSTEVYDRGAKSAHFRRLESLQGYLLVSTAQRHVELYVRNGDGWHLTEARGAEPLVIPPLEMSLLLEEVYAGSDVPA